jgi:hypothetical protein
MMTAHPRAVFAFAVPLVTSSLVAADNPRLTWQVMVDPKDPEGFHSLVTLLVNDKNKETRYDAGRGVGFASAYNQAICGDSQYPKNKNEISKIVLYEGGATVVAIVKKGSRYLLTKRFETDGACEDRDGHPAPCPPGKPTTIAKVRLSSATIDESIVVKNDTGQWVPFDCNPP